MAKKLHKHSITINDKRRDKKRTTDFMKNGFNKGSLQVVFNTFYKDQVRALYRTITKK